MIITCEECSSSFSVNDDLIKDSGSKVRCSKCDSVFVAYPQAADETGELETAEDDLTLESDDQLLGEDEDLGMDDLDSDLGDFLEEDEGESELEVADFEDTPEADLDSDDTSEALELDLDDDSDLALEEDSFAGDDLPDLGDLEDLTEMDGEELSWDESESELEGLDLELESDSDEETESGGDEGLDLADLGLEEEDTSSPRQSADDEEDQALAVEGTDELDLSDLESAIDEQTVTLDLDEIDSDELSLELESDAADTGETTPAAPEELSLELESDDDAAEAAADELDLSDLDLEMEDDTVPDEAPAEITEDLDLDLDLDLEGETVAGTDDGADDELDLSDLTDIIEDESEPAAEAQAEDLDLELKLEDDALEGGGGGGGEPAAADSGDIEELDLSDLEGIMDSEETPTAETSAGDSAPVSDEELRFQLDDGAPAGEAAAVDPSDDELDFSDLEQMLESDETPSVDAAEGGDADELELQFDLDEPATGGTEAEDVEDAGASAEDDDFLDIEQLLEEGEDSEPSADAGLDGDVTDLPLEMEAALDDASKETEDELELDFNLESELQAKEDLFDADEPANEQLESNLLASDEVEFLEEAGIEETEFRDASETSVLGTDDFASEELAETDGTYGATHVLPGSETDLPIMDAEDEGPVDHQPPTKSRSKKPLLVVVLLLFLAVGVVIIPNMLGIKIPYISDIKIPYLSDLDVRIPYLSDWLNPQPQDVAGNLKLIPLGNTINGKFVDNARSGQLFVIQGQIKNDYDHPRSYIKVTGKLYLKGKKKAKQATVFCGNTISDSELAAMDIHSINKKLRTRSGNKQSNFKVKTGRRVPFMIVFDKLPQNLDEYTVEVEGSSL